MKGAPFIAFYPSDWLAGTRALSAVETGIYITLVAMMYERQEPLAMDEARLARLCGASVPTFRKALSALIDEGKILVVDGGLWQDRVDRELKKRAEKSDSARDSANNRWRKSKENQRRSDADAMRTQCEHDAIHNHNHIPPKSPKGFEEDFAEFWKAYPKRAGGNPRKTALKAYTARRKAGATHDAIMQALRAFTAEQQSMGKIGTVYIPMASSWLNREEWADEADQPEAPSAAETRDEVWRGATRLYLDRGTWRLSDRSPPPDDPNTLVPPAILREFNITQAA